MTEKKKICKLLNGKWNDEIQGCELMLKDIQVKNDYLYVTFEKSVLTVHSWDSEAELPNYLNISLSSPQENKLRREMWKAPKRSPERRKIIEKLEPFNQFQNLIEKD